ncbi:MAG: amidohydrolase [Planctomycetota bacterium]
MRRLLSVLALTACAGPAVDQAVLDADLVLFGGPVLTIVDDAPTAEAVAVKDGRIVAVGSESDVFGAVGDDVRRVDLKGRTLLPGFVDSHGHAQMIGFQASTANLLPPPDGTGASVAALQSLLNDWADSHAGAVERFGWIVGFGYDDSQLEEGRHPTRDELDVVSSDLPVLIIHQSGHLGVANSKALEIAGVTAATPDPKGGVFRRREGSNEPNGVLEEYAMFAVLTLLIERFDAPIAESLVIEGTRLLASYGYTTAQDGRSIGPGVDAMRSVAARGELDIDLVAYPDILETEDVQPSRDYRGGFRVGGVKLTIDGSPQGKTAWLSEPYYVAPEGQPEDYRGYAAIDETTTFDAVARALGNDWQILCHANGDAAIDRFIDAVRAASTDRTPALRPVLIHGQTLREDQVVALQELGIFPSLFPMHTFYWGDWHRDSVLGPERAENISPTGWLTERGMIFGSHHDAPVALPDSMRVLSATVTRKTRSGQVLGPEHCVSVMDALKSLTIWPAWQHFEEDAKGTIEVGKLADFVVLSDNPMTIDPDLLDDLVVVETFKEGESIYRRSDSSSAQR